MRCIEISTDDWTLQGVAKINRNMRCIEIQEQGTGSEGSGHD